MKKRLSGILFAITFVLIYILLCFAYPGGKMAIEATPFDYIRVAITYMALVKTIVSLVAAVIVVSIKRIFDKVTV